MADAHQPRGPNAIEAADPGCLAKVLKVSNLGNAIFLAFAAVWWFVMLITSTCTDTTTGSDETKTGYGCGSSIGQSLSAIYVCIFAILLLFFELHCKKFDKSIFALFGFMFSWHGRLFFLFFIGLLAFTIEDVGIAAGCYTLVNIIFNYYALAHNAPYKAYIQQLNRTQQFAAKEAHFKSQGVEMKPGGGGAIPSSFGGGGGGGGSGFPGEEELAPKANQNPTGPDWERFHDAESGAYYYYNHKTKVTQWENA